MICKTSRVPSGYKAHQTGILFTRFLFLPLLMSSLTSSLGAHPALYGTTPASQPYQHLLYSFMHHLGMPTRDARRVTIYQLDSDAIEHSPAARAARYWDNPYEEGIFQEIRSALTRTKKCRIGIWINEPFLQKSPQCVTLFVLAHEAAHCALGTFMDENTDIHIAREREKVTDLAAAHMLCRNGYRDDLQAYVHNLRTRPPQEYDANDLHPPRSEKIMYLQQVLDETEDCAA